MALAPKDEYWEKLRVVDLHLVVFRDADKFFSANDLKDTIVSAYAILIDDDSAIYRKKAAYLLLKALLKKDFLEKILEEDFAPYERKDNRVKKWADAIKSRGKCERCGSGKELEAHHILKWSEYPSGRIDPKNGMCLCNKCHAKEHRGEQAEHLILGRKRR